MYDYGYSMMIKGRLRPVVLGKFDTDEYESKKAEIIELAKNDEFDRRGWFIRLKVPPYGSESF